MKNNERPINYERPQDQYDVFERAIYNYFTSKVNSQTKLYRVRTVEDILWNAYLDNLPEEGRFVYDCRKCRDFIERYGSLVTIDNFGRVESVLWGAIVPEYFAKSVATLNYLVTSRAYTVEDIFYSDVQTLGTPRTGIWAHLHVNLPYELVNKSRTRNAEQLMAEKREDRRTLINALQEYPINVVEQAVALLETDVMYRGEGVLGRAKWFLDLHKAIEGETSVVKHNLIWKAVGEAPTGFCHIKSSVIGSLLDDIVAGYSTRLIIARFEEKMNPQSYMRSQSAPTASAIEQAEKLINKLSIADSLRRRYARFGEVSDKCFWRPRGPLYKFLEKSSEAKTTGIFSHLTPKDAKPSNDISLDLPVTTMTWAKFSKTILPTAEKLSVKIDNPNRFMALVTEAVPGSENILQWDNPFSWYYHGGIDGEMKRRVEAAGGKYENCEIRCSLMWDNYTDLDLHAEVPTFGYNHIYYRNKRIGSGYLDVDANGGSPTTMTPVENIRWASQAPNGHYKFFVHNYEDRNCCNNPYTVELEAGGKIRTCAGFLGRTNEKALAFEFDYYNGEVSHLRTDNPVTSSGNSTMWGLTMNEFVEVKGILESPNMWGTNEGRGDNQHTFFILDGCKDESEGKGRGFFNEILKPELREIRKTLEAYTASTPIECAEEADACGVGFTKDRDWNLTLKVEREGKSRLVKIDRFD